jgi:hypothetical protein
MTVAIDRPVENSSDNENHAWNTDVLDELTQDNEGNWPSTEVIDGEVIATSPTSYQAGNNSSKSGSLVGNYSVSGENAEDFFDPRASTLAQASSRSYHNQSDDPDIGDEQGANIVSGATIFDEAIQELEHERDTLIQKRESESWQLLLPATQSSQGQVLYELDEKTRLALLNIYRQYNPEVAIYEQSRRDEIQAANEQNAAKGKTTKIKEYDPNSIEAKTEKARIFYRILNEPDNTASLQRLLREFQNNPLYQNLSQSKVYAQQQSNEQSFFSSLGLPMPTNNTNASNSQASPINKASSGYSSNKDQPVRATQLGSTTTARNATANSLDGDNTPNMVGAGEDNIALRNYIETINETPYEPSLTELNNLKRGIEETKRTLPNVPIQVEVKLPAFGLAYQLNRWIHKGLLNKLNLAFSSFLARRWAMAALTGLFFVLALISFIFLVAMPSSAAIGSNSGVTNATNNVQTSKNLPELVIILPITAAPTIAPNTTTPTVMANTNPNTTISNSVAATTITPTEIPPIPTPANAHGTYSAPSRLEIPALGFKAPIIKAEVIQDGNQVRVAWPSGDNQDKIAHYGAYPGQKGNMVLIGNSKAFGVAAGQLQVNDYLEAYNRELAEYTYQVIPLGTNGEPEAIAGCGNADFLAGSTGGNDAYLTIIMPYLSDENIEATATARVQPQHPNSVGGDSNNKALAVPTPTPPATNSGAAANSNNNEGLTGTVVPIKCTPLDGSHFGPGVTPQAQGDPRTLVRVWRAKLVAKEPKPQLPIGTPIATTPTVTVTPTYNNNSGSNHNNGTATIPGATTASTNTNVTTNGSGNTSNNITAATSGSNNGGTNR